MRDKNRMKTVFEKEIDRLQAENRDLRNMLKKAENKLKRAEDGLRESDFRYQELKKNYEKFLFDYSEKIEAAEEARIAYEDGNKRLHSLLKQYKKEADQWISAMKSQGKAV